MSADRWVTVTPADLDAVAVLTDRELEIASATGSPVVRMAAFLEECARDARRDGPLTYTPNTGTMGHPATEGPNL